MASSVTKKRVGRHDYWMFCFTSIEKEQLGLPRQKWFSFSADRFKKSDVTRIRDEWEKKYRAGSYDPWQEKDVIAGHLTLDQAVELYLNHERRNLAGTTYTTYSDYLNRMIVQLENPFVEPLKSETINLWVNDSDKWNTRRTKKAVADQLFNFLYESGRIKKKPVIKAYGTTAEKNQAGRDSITESELFDFLQALDDLQGRRRIKDEKRHRWIKQVARVMFYNGLRIEELMHCRPAWILDDFKLLVIGDLQAWGLPDHFMPKSQKIDLPIAIPSEVTDEYRSAAKGRFEPMFAYRSKYTIRNVFKEGFIEAFGENRSKRLSPHSLRHSCASYWLNERKVPVQEVQRLLRHSKIQTTMNYYHPSTDAHYNAFQD